MAEVQLFNDSDFKGGQITVFSTNESLLEEGFSDRLSSVIVVSGTFTLFEHIKFGGFSFTVCKTGGQIQMEDTRIRSRWRAEMMSFPP
jgi:hypothetical protein